VQGLPGQGYQLPFTPAQLFKAALRGIHDEFANKASSFAQLDAAAQDAWLEGLTKAPRDLDGVPSGIFFQTLLDATIEGFFSDPAYGGNRDMVGWKLIGFPGAYGNYYDVVDKHGLAFRQPPISIAQNGHGHGHGSPAADRAPGAARNPAPRSE
jgi:gluconate 2-dehydrogenase gamma chain